MAGISLFSKTQLIALTFLSLLATTLAAKSQEEKSSFVKKLSKNMHFGYKKEKLSHFRFYWHDIYGGKNPSAVSIVRPPNNNTVTQFGALAMIDDPLTEGPEISSKLLGKAQGFYGFASQEEVSLLMAMNFYFVQGKYNGSTITILGRNPVFNKVREMPVIGGSGLFRFARGYAQASTHKFDAATKDATVEYNVYVLHY